MSSQNTPSYNGAPGSAAIGGGDAGGREGGDKGGKKTKREGVGRWGGAAGHGGEEAEKIWKVRNNENWGKQRKIKGKEGYV